MLTGLHIAKVAPHLALLGNTASFDAGSWDQGGPRDITFHISYHLELLAASRTESAALRARRGLNANPTKAGRGEAEGTGPQPPSARPRSLSTHVVTEIHLLFITITKP